MRKLFNTLVFFLCLNCITKGQGTAIDIVGIWQNGSKEITSGWFDNYQFFSNGTFRFNIDQNEGTKRIICIGGKYKIINDSLVLIIKYANEIKGGYLSRSETISRSGWEIKGGKIVTIKFKKTILSYLKIETCLGHVDSIPCILIDKIKFYKLEYNPYNYY